MIASILIRFKIISNQSRFVNGSLWSLVRQAFSITYRILLFKYAYSSMLLGSLNLRSLRAKCWRKIGCTVGDHVCIGHSVSLDYGNAHLITIEDYVMLTNNCSILCHRRDLSTYKHGDNAADLPYIYAPVTIRRGAQIGMGTIIMPGVTIGEGAIVGAHAVVSKDIPAWTVAVGNPAKVIKNIQ